MDPCASLGDKVLSGGSMMMSAGGPGPKSLYEGLGKAGKKVLGAAKKGARKLPDLPRLDATGKVHGELPNPADFSKYDRDELFRLQEELRQSVQERIRKTNELGRHRPHGQRQGAEQDTINAIEKFLNS